MAKEKFVVIFAFVAVLNLLTGCGEEKVVEFDSLQQRGGVYVVPETQKPYSGKFVETTGKNVVIKAGSLKNGKLHGELTTYREDGSIDNVETFVQDVLNGKFEEYHENGKLKSVGYYKDGKEEGKIEDYYENGQLESLRYYIDGKEDGKGESYYENGQLQFVGYSKNGELDGKIELYYESGKLENVQHYKDGKLDGKWEDYHENGQLKSVQYYKDGKEDGKWEVYYENGQLDRVLHYKDGKPDGKWEFYDKNGKLVFTVQMSSLNDHRDGRTYTTVNIGLQNWMAENLNYNVEGSICYDNDPANCEKYGRLYYWRTARSACPSGWHLPSKSEWEVLDKAVGGEKVAGKLLKTRSGWDNNGNGIDLYSFSALPGGYGVSNSRYAGYGFLNVGHSGYWWSAADNSYGAYRQLMDYFSDDVVRYDYGDYYLYSVRCVQDHIVNSMLTNIETKNVQLIKRYE